MKGQTAGLLSHLMAVKFQGFFVVILLAGLLFVSDRGALAQSPDQNLPTAVLSNEITGKILPLDLGDPRLTRRYYAFEGTPGDVLITMESKNLNGDIDIFTAITFRPLMKTSLYASVQSPEVTKSIYLRSRQILILRVEARTPNDEEGTYRVRFHGSFAPFSGGIPVAENNQTESDSADAARDTNRLSSVGATMAQPAGEIPPVTAEPNPAEKPAEETAAAKQAAAAKAKPARPTARNSRGRAPRPTRQAGKAKAAQPVAANQGAGAPVGQAAPGSSGSETSTQPAAQELPLAGAHLIIESKDGTKTDRPMSAVRRVVIDGNVIVIVLKTGKVERIPMSAVARMAIEP